MRRLFVFIVLCIFLNALSSETIPRTVLALYDSEESLDIFYTEIHRHAEMPLNHLGIIVEYHDIQKGLPDISNRHDLIGILTWFEASYSVPNSKDYLEWAIKTIDSGKKFVIQGNPGFINQKDYSLESIVTFFKKLGLNYIDNWIDDTYDIQLSPVKSPMVGFETSYKGKIASFYQLSTFKKEAHPHLIATRTDSSLPLSVLISTSKNGGYVALGYSILHLANGDEDWKAWFLNPFAFYQKAFALQRFPIPDTTTLAGKRIYYSHIDGDGWLSRTELENYRNKYTLASDVIYQEILLPYKDFPVSVGPIAAEIDFSWVGNKAGNTVAENIFKLPHIEMASHTYSHPLYWEFFEDYNPQDEEPLLDLYPHGSWKGWNITDIIKKIFNKNSKEKKENCDLLSDKHCKTKLERLHAFGYTIPRAYAKKTFDITLEIEGSVKKINELSSSEKQVDLLLWSGNTLPFEKALELSKNLNIANLNGGDTRFDENYLSYSWVKPLGRKVGPYQQIYSSNSNENTYTTNWTDRFYGFNDLKKTFFNTDVPIRVKPMNIYYHMYTGEKLASLNALKENLAYVQTQNFIPIKASLFSTIVVGFYSANISITEPGVWKVENRGELQTFRMDQASLQSVDFSKSKGVIGQKHINSSLYIYLDSQEKMAEISLKPTENYWEEPSLGIFYLIESQWPVRNVRRKDKTRVTFIAEGFGTCNMVWKTPEEGVYTIDVENQSSQTLKSTDNELHLSLELSQLTPQIITITKTQ